MERNEQEPDNRRAYADRLQGLERLLSQLLIQRPTLEFRAPLLRSGPNCNAILSDLAGTVRCDGCPYALVGVLDITVHRVLGGH